jgi:hypothetical protein
MRFLKYKIILTLLMLSNVIVSQQIKNGEYFFNNDPGYGNGVSFDVTETNGEFTKVIETSVESLPIGFNTFYVRVKQNNTWSTFDRNMLYKIDSNNAFTGDQSIKNITSAEYFIDSDPGYGKGETISITETNELDATFSVDISSLEKGVHIIYVRVKSINNQWSNFDRRLFYISTKEELTFSESPIAKAEYFFDTDTGYGNGESIALDASGKEISQAFTVDVSSLSAGFHTVYFRVQNENKEWSTFERAMFYISDNNFTMPEESPIVAAEYFFNEFVEIGEGSVISLATNADGDFETSINTGDLLEGDHLLFIRAKNEANVWSLYDVVAFTIDNSLGVDKVLAKDFIVYPNAVIDKINIESKHDIVSYKIYDIQGKVVLKDKMIGTIINAHQLKKGIYFLTLKTKKGTIVKRLVKE